MLFVGEFRHTLDAKNRIFIPAKYRTVLGSSFYITRKMEKCLAIYSEEEWTRLTEKLNSQPDSKVGLIKQFLYSKTVNVVPDSQGRIVIPADLMKYAAIDKNAVVIGVGDHVQIWAEALWNEKEENIDTEALMEQLRELGI